ncbi:hypothetical protein DL546_007083 [Coniochaeta pulveracea]|uniref:Uncharacterized protein n=1 Tax=Coniochaeta pulveracea TaxID=177199 RepID=A0A420YK83_9PEZI|nr:hypothetical protein DL546_007083 [Coniochaeta pulveracea]
MVVRPRMNQPASKPELTSPAPICPSELTASCWIHHPARRGQARPCRFEIPVDCGPLAKFANLLMNSKTRHSDVGGGIRIIVEPDLVSKYEPYERPENLPSINLLMKPDFWNAGSDGYPDCWLVSLFGPSQPATAAPYNL